MELAEPQASNLISQQESSPNWSLRHGVIPQNHETGTQTSSCASLKDALPAIICAISLAVFRRSIAATLLLLLHAVDFYSKIIEPNLPIRWRAELSPYIDRAENWDLYLAWLIIFFAVLYTFYETDSQVTREPNVVRQLKKF